MTREEEIKVLWDMGVGQQKNWKYSDIPIASRNPGAVENAWAKLTKKMSDEERLELLNKIKLAIVAQTRFRRDQRLAGDQEAQPVMLSRYLNEKRYDNPIASHAEIKEKKQEQRFCECGKLVHPGHIKCEYHLSTSGGILMQEMRQFFKDNDLKRGPGEGTDDYTSRMRTLAKQWGYQANG